MHPWIGMQSAEHLGVHAGHAGWRFQQSLAIGILTHGEQNLPHGPFYPGMIHGVAALADSVAAGRAAVGSSRASATRQAIGIA
jgi:hypothetical protein